MSDIKIQPSATGSATVTLTAPTTGTARTVTLPDSTATLATTTDVAARLPSITDNGDATAMTITSAEHIGIGTSSPAITESRQAGKFVTVYSTATNGSILELASNKNTDNDTVGIVSFINTENGDTSGGTRKYLAQIRGKVETNDSNAQDDSGGNLVFQTKADGGTIDDRLTITSDGRGLSQFTAKAWVNFNGTGTVAIRDSHNVSSITDSGTGNYIVYLSNAFSNSNGVAVIGGDGYNIVTAFNSTSAVSLQNLNTSIGNADNATLFCTIFGD